MLFGLLPVVVVVVGTEAAADPSFAAPLAGVLGTPPAGGVAAGGVALLALGVVGVTPMAGSVDAVGAGALAPADDAVSVFVPPAVLLVPAPCVSPSGEPVGALGAGDRDEVDGASMPRCSASELMSLAQPPTSANRHNQNDHRFMRVSCSSPCSSNAHATRKHR
jgi:hypothetical protein